MALVARSVQLHPRLPTYQAHRASTLSVRIFIGDAKRPGRVDDSILHPRLVRPPLTVLYTFVGSETISAGGDEYDEDGTTYTALPSGFGVRVVAAGQTTTYNPASNIDGATTIDDVTVITSTSATGGSGGGSQGKAFESC